MKTIRFVGKQEEMGYYLKLGSMDAHDPPEREFKGGDEVKVEIQLNDINSDCVDLTFEDGQIAIEVPKEFFIEL
ncbi:MAG: hypothetical protein DWQ19_10140 [Crenarchaeota archaeon]|nr:MAG: hypothetical protein DWQ19_10140 [Thermoproteota archaeon]